MAGTSTVRFAYDALGRRTGKEVIRPRQENGAHGSGGQTRFVWQGMRMVQEIGARRVSTYVYDPDADYTPLARLDQALAADGAIDNDIGGALYHFHTDQIGTPQEVTNENGDIVWAGRFDAWGKLKGQILGAPLAVGGMVTQNLRFAGQYADDETGLHYNTFRYYDPDVGRFISQDPIGLKGGNNLYQYAPNPITWIDPLGLAGAPIVVIGEGQGAVDEAARLLSAQGYAAESMMFPKNQWRGGDLYDGMSPADFEKTVQWNKNWLTNKINQGYQVVDIGPDGRADPSRFYEAEQAAIKETGASKITLKKFGNGETVADMRARKCAC